MVMKSSINIIPLKHFLMKVIKIGLTKKETEEFRELREWYSEVYEEHERKFKEKYADKLKRLEFLSNKSRIIDKF